MLKGLNSQPIGSEKSAQNIKVSKAQSSGQTIKPSAPIPAAARSAASFAATAGLPSDKLSSSIVSFARFFSLPLKPQLLTNIRSQAFLQSAQTAQPASVNPAQTGDSSTSLISAKMREALSLAAAAAESKGVELSPRGLESYAEAVDPEWEKRDEQQRKKRGKEQNEHAEKASLKPVSITADSLKKMAFEYAEENPILDILNVLPGKDGQRWIVLPFDFYEDGKEFKISMRILLEPEMNILCDDSSRAACMALDVSIDNKQRWLFVIEAANNKPMRLAVYTMPEDARLKKELSRLLEIPIERIAVKNREESFPYESSYLDGAPAIDEAV